MVVLGGPWSADGPSTSLMMQKAAHMQPLFLSVGSLLPAGCMDPGPCADVLKNRQYWGPESTPPASSHAHPWHCLFPGSVFLEECFLEPHLKHGAHQPSSQTQPLWIRPGSNPFLENPESALSSCVFEKPAFHRKGDCDYFVNALKMY